ncbi:cysteine and glycine-rich protein 1 [Eurytemora carolleeae]|uniref:cysteine and glycine-rich protein 1 n=1 Tax=Eurytemora carolleeae TaxID=1294199 RepID=UPI000C77EFA0|nr:cysteine and glycine-rich protein 1 [Eurytemora carolleeae]|eukprot:XP_023324100.1 cysteine and glycine-rich protein 1-like [Eurytemora affinis]
MPWTNPNPSPICPTCSRSVFPAEAYMASDRRPHHKQCVKCVHCSKRLSASTLNEHAGKLYCNLCYTNMFMPQENNIEERVVMQVLPVGGIYTALEEEKRRAEEERRRKEMEERARKEGGCPSCCTMTTEDDSVALSGVRYHKKCLRCSRCSKPEDESVPMLLGPKDTTNVFGEEELEPYCNFCFAKKFKMSAIKIAETVAIDTGYSL